MEYRLHATRRSMRSGLALLLLLAGASTAQDARRGQYVANLGGCVACHTEDKKGAPPFAGGRALKTPFGVFYGPNITPHPEAGVGRWSEADFVRAMRLGVRPDNAHYFPAFPYTSFTRIGDRDLRDLWAYLKSLPPNPRASRPHELKFPFSLRAGVGAWKWLYFKPGPFAPDPARTAQANLGAYIVESLSHCGECHTPRNMFGGYRAGRALAGGKGVDGKDVPNLTPANLKKWSDSELKEVLTTGMTPDMDMVSASMAEVVENTTSQISTVDLDAVIAYLRSLTAVADEKGSDEKSAGAKTGP